MTAARPGLPHHFALSHEPVPRRLWDEQDMHDYADQIAAQMAAQHDKRVTELLEANNREVERRRAAEEKVREVSHIEAYQLDD